MNVETRNQFYLDGIFDSPGLFPSLEMSLQQPIVFDMDFGLNPLPLEPGLINVRGARQFGKSTWLESQLKSSLLQFGPGSSFYLNGDDYRTHEDLGMAIAGIHSFFPKESKKSGNSSAQLPSQLPMIRRLFIDEITSVKDWEKAIKKLYDEGLTRRTLIITTGSKAVDLRKGSERLPGRKGKLDRTIYRFLPISFSEFEKKCRSHFGSRTLMAYLMCGGSPVAANELVQSSRIPPYVIEMTKDWIFGECSRQGRDPSLLQFLLHMVHSKSCSPISMTKLAKESGAANNNIVQSYIELMRNLMSVSACFQADPHTLRPIPRKAGKIHFINLLAALAFDPDKAWTLDEFCQQSNNKLGKWFEWAVASHLWRQASYKGETDPESQYFWSNENHEIDFISSNQWIEVKSGGVSAAEFLWFSKSFPRHHLTVVQGVIPTITKASVNVTKAAHPSFMSKESLEDFLRS